MKKASVVFGLALVSLMMLCPRAVLAGGDKQESQKRSQRFLSFFFLCVISFLKEYKKQVQS
ncbi:MAG: hypothetical protein LBT14_02320 [Treponema sp.]|nr:hypothetical protein [Treponema sp.]